MKRVLLVYPEGDSAHALRIIRPLARHLPDLGWKPVLLTQTGQGRTLEIERIEVDARHVASTNLNSGPSHPSAIGAARRLAGRLRSIVGRHMVLPDRYIWWSWIAARRVHQDSSFQAIFSAGPPHSAHLIGAAYRRRHGVPWVADMRDAWSTNHYTVYNPFARRIDRGLERAILKRATRITTVSAGIAREVAAVHGRPVDCIPNSFDVEEAEGMPPPSFRPLKLSYAGSLIGGRRDPAKIMDVIAVLRARRPDLPVRARFATDLPGLVSTAAHAAGVDDVVESGGWVARKGVLDMWRDASVLVLLRWDDPREADVPTGKLFEYLGARRPILSMGGPPGVVGEILEDTGGGRHVETAAEAASYLEDLAASGWSAPEDLQQFNSAAMAVRFFDLLEAM